LLSWTKREVWGFIHKHSVPYNPLHDEGYPSVGCWPCTRPISDGEDDRAGRWSGTVRRSAAARDRAQEGTVSRDLRFKIADCRFEFKSAICQSESAIKANYAGFREASMRVSPCWSSPRAMARRSPCGVKTIADHHGIPQRFLVQMPVQLKGPATLPASAELPAATSWRKHLKDFRRRHHPYHRRPQPARPASSASAGSESVQAVWAVWKEVQAEEERVLAELTLDELVRRAQQFQRLVVPDLSLSVVSGQLSVPPTSDH